MKSLAGRVKRLQVQRLGIRGRCPVCGLPLDDGRSRGQEPKLSVMFEGDPLTAQCAECGRPRILKITFDERA